MWLLALLASGTVASLLYFCTTNNSKMHSVIKSLESKLCFFLPKSKTCVEVGQLALKQHQLVYFGEQHQQPAVLGGQLAVLTQLLSPTKDQLKIQASEPPTKYRVHLVFEMFNLNQQTTLLDPFMRNELSMNELHRIYHEQSTEGFDIAGHYGQLLVKARELGAKVRAGFVPKEYARRISRGESTDAVLNDCLKAGWKSTVETFQNYPGTDAHYQFFKKLVTGHGTFDMDEERIKILFQAQLLKDASLGAIVHDIVKANPEDKVLVICGSGHSDYGFGGPERVPKEYSRFIISSRPKQSVDMSAVDFCDALLVYEFQE